ncbi:MAG TPA: metallophosphoesterase family protein [Ktedonobacterales bacterium]|nr:metallophosphoesterase family protein [Ktedonobacterales bacterium]
MRLAIISDVHGNLTALEAVLTDMRDPSGALPERIVCLGDVAQMGPQPHETIVRLRALGCPVIMGNTDDKLIKRVERLAIASDTSDTTEPLAKHGKETSKTAPDEKQRSREINWWTARQVTADDLTYLRTFVPTLEVALGSAEGGRALLCCHGSPRSYNDRTEATTPDEKLGDWLADVDEARVGIVASGHTHLQMLRRYQALTLLNPGSVGMPLMEVKPGEFRLAPCAEYAILTYDGQQPGLRIELRRVSYNTSAVIAGFLASDMPHTEWTTTDWQALPHR